MIPPDLPGCLALLSQGPGSVQALLITGSRDGLSARSEPQPNLLKDARGLDTGGRSSSIRLSTVLESWVAGQLGRWLLRQSLKPGKIPLRNIGIHPSFPAALKGYLRPSVSHEPSLTSDLGCTAHVPLLPLSVHY